MRLRDMLLTSALSGSLALYPLALHAQNFDTWTLGREVLNSAANYTGVLTTAHREVQKYITWDWSTSLDEDAQQTRTDALLAEITESQQINAELVPSLKIDVLNSYDVRFRYCDNMLLSYFDGAVFKHGLSAQQIIDAPVLRAQRAGRTFNRDQLGRVVDDPTVGGVMMLQTNGGSRPMPIPACMGDDYGGALPDGTVAYMTPARRKPVPRPELSPKTEERSVDCPPPFSDGPKTLTQTRDVERSYRFPDPKHLQDFPELWKAETETYGEWAVLDDGCYKLVNAPTPQYRPDDCPPGQTGSRSSRRDITVQGRDYHSAAKRKLPPTYGAWRTVSNTCRYIPPPPPKPDCSAGSYRGRDDAAWYRRGCGGGSSSSGRGGGRDGGSNRDSGSVDVNNDGYGDFKDHDSRGFGGTSVSSGCGGCNGPAGGGRPGERGKDGKSGGDGGGGGKGRVICTELWRQGLVSRELAVMDLRFTAEHLTPTHYRGYHAWAIPVVHKMRHSARWTAVWKVLAVARMNEIAWQLGKADRPDYLGKIVRHTLEPLSYLIGLFVDESDIAALYRTERNRKEISHV